MKREDFITRLETLNVPDVYLDDHRRELRASLLVEYARVNPTNQPTVRHRSRSLRWRTVLITSAAWLLIVIILVTTNVLPISWSYLETQNAINAVLAYPIIKDTLATDGITSVSVTPLRDDEVEVVIASGGETTIVAHLETRRDQVKIIDITYIILFGSIFEPEETITGQEADKILTIASNQKAFRKLLDKGVKVERIVSIEALVSKRWLSTGEESETRSKWAIVELAQDNQRWTFLVDPSSSTVINRSPSSIPY